MAVGNFSAYDKAMEYIVINTVDLDGDTFKVMYLDNTYTPNTASHSAVTNLTSAELSASDGTSLRQTLSSVTVTPTTSGGSSVVKWDAADVTMSTSSTVKVRYVAIYDDLQASTTNTDSKVICLSELTSTGTGVPATQLTVEFSSSGILKFKRG
jgi:hypothetical protein